MITDVKFTVGSIDLIFFQIPITMLELKQGKFKISKDPAISPRARNKHFNTDWSKHSHLLVVHAWKAAYQPITVKPFITCAWWDGGILAELNFNMLYQRPIIKKNDSLISAALCLWKTCFVVHSFLLFAISDCGGLRTSRSMPVLTAYFHVLA